MLIKIPALCALAAVAPLLATQDPASNPAETEAATSGATEVPVQDGTEVPPVVQDPDPTKGEAGTEDAKDSKDAGGTDGTQDPEQAGEELGSIDTEGADDPLPNPFEVEPAKKNSLEIQEEEYFTTADYDENGWISFREAESSLHLNRDGFAQYDANTDGQVTREEFHIRYTELVQRVGLFRIPTPAGQTSADLAATPDPAPESTFPATSQAFVDAYDVNVDGRLDTNEIGPAAAALGFPGIDPNAVLTLLDTNRTGYVEPAEVEAIIQTLNASGATITVPLASSVEELFGQSVERPYFVGATPRPPYIAGPVIPFRRLDANNNGFIEVIDLEQLSVSAHTLIRPSAVLAGLDKNGDSKLSPEELAAAFDG